MANPTFRETDLFDEAARDLPQAPQPRLQIEAMPGIDGWFVQTHGTAGREIKAHGLISQTGTTCAQAHQNVKTRLRALQELVADGVEGTYVGTDGAVYSTCLLESFAPEGPVEMTRLGETSYLASIACKATIQQLVCDEET
jgi:hypothetical protein